MNIHEGRMKCLQRKLSWAEFAKHSQQYFKDANKLPGILIILASIFDILSGRKLHLSGRKSYFYPVENYILSGRKFYFVQ